MFVCLLFLSNLAAVSYAQTKPQDDALPETFRLRINNSIYGPVEASSDKGATWYLIARVLKPAVDRAPCTETTLPVVLRGGVTGFAISIGSNHLLRVLPESLGSKPDVAAITLNVPARTWPFTELLPTNGALVQQQSANRLRPIPLDYAPSNEDILVIIVSHPGVTQESARTIVSDCAQQYDARARKQLELQKKRPSNGILTVNVNLPNEDKIAALTYYLDGSLVAIQNRAPFVMRQDTRKWTNGEHVIEARAVDSSNHQITSRKTLVYVENPPNTPQSDIESRNLN